MKKEMLIENLERIAKISSERTSEEYSYEAVVSDWQNYGKDRTYLKVVEYRNGSKTKEADYGFYDNIADKYITSKKYGNLEGTLFDFSGSKIQ